MTSKVIDVSYWQKDIDYDAVVDAGVEGVIIKISEGCTEEETWRHHVDQCIERGLKWGVYVYSHATTPERVREEAETAIMLLSGLPTPPMGIWFDCEAPECFEEGVDTTAICSAFIVECNEAGFTAGIYSSSLKFTDYMENSIQPNLLADYVPYWIADYRGYNGFAQTYPDKHVAGWQWSDKEYIGDTNVDMNEWYEEL